jgi:tetratricopeptide (TPR) repeat protein
MSSTLKQRSQQLKLQGNKLYGEHRFEEAYNCYREASKLEPDNPIYIANQSAVLFETGLYPSCIALCDIAISRLNGQVDATSLSGRLTLRKAKSYFLTGNYENARLCLIQLADESDTEWKTLMASVKEHQERDKQCHRTENPPLAFDCSVPSIRGSLQPIFYSFDIPISHVNPTSIFQSNSSAFYPSILDLRQKPAGFEQNSYNLLFAHNTDPRHILETLMDAKSHIGSETTADSMTMVIHVLESNPRILAKMILILFVMGHPDLDEARSRIASEFVYFLWLGVGLIPPHWTMLSETLHEICKLSFNLETWRLDPRSSWIRFGDERDLKLVRDCWIIWGTATEDQTRSKSSLVAQIDRLKLASSDHIQRKHAKIVDQSFNSKLECVREVDFFNRFRIILPRPPLLEGDKEVPPKSMFSWMLNPTMDVSDPLSTEQTENKRWLPEPRPDAIYPFGKSQPRDQLMSFALYTSGKIFDTIMSINYLRKSGKLELRGFCGQFLDLCDVGSRLGSIVKEEEISFDRIHTGNLSESIGVMETWLNSTLLLSKHPHSAFFTCLGEQNQLQTSSSTSKLASYENLDHLLWNKLRLEKSHLHARFGLDIHSINDSTLVWSLSTLSPHDSSLLASEEDISMGLRRTDIIAKSNSAYKTEHLIHNVFAMCCLPTPSSSIQHKGQQQNNVVVEPASCNMMAFVRFLTLLLESGTPKHWISSAVESILSGSIKASMVDEPYQPLQSKKPHAFFTTPYLMELKTLMTIAAGGRLMETGINFPGLLEEIDSCHWFQAENIKIQNYPPTRVLPSNPSIVALIVDRRISFDTNLTLVERLATVQSQAALRDLFEQHDKHIDIVSSVYWTGPPKIEEPSGVTFGVWLPPSFLAKSKPSTAFTILLFRFDIYMCIGLSSLASMSCTTGDLSS